ncbi:ankyrin repeat-containing domain protein [Annulohypoxylon nitens]|nr:ankyrin repeat-containing domain protein [Annulohypoxylon nitens]
MALPARQILQEEWDAHEDTIKRLYYVDKLPLQSKKGGKRTLIEVMEDEHGFSASASQYESKFRKWGLAKNLDKREWEKLLWQYEELQQQGREPRIMISGSVVEEPRRKRARRGYVPERHIDYAIPPERQAYVEFHDDTSGSWLRYNDNGPAAESLNPTHNSGYQNADAQGDGDTIVSDLDQIPALQNSHLTAGQHVASPMELAAANTSFSDPFWGLSGSNLFNDYIQGSDFGGHTYINSDEIEDHIVSGPHSDRATTYQTPNALFFQPGLLSPGNAFGEASRENGYRESVTANAHESFSSSQDLQVRPKGLAQALLQRAKWILGNNATPFQGTYLPDVEDIVDNLASLLPEDIDLETTALDSQIIEKKASFGPGFKTLLYSIINGFAGLRDLPRSAILRLIRDDSQIQSHLFKLLNTSPPSIARPLADNLFRAAVESCDPQAVAAIMNTTGKNSNISIDVNNIRCEFRGRDYTPVELAAKFRNIEIVQALLTAKADPNKTYSESEHDERGALELAIRKWGYLERVDLKLVKLLLTCGSEVRMSLAEAVVRWGFGDKDLLQLLMNEIQDSQHSAVFGNRRILVDIVQYIENGAANHIVRRLFGACTSTNCGKCASNHPKLIQDMLVNASKRGNFDTVEFLLPHTKERQLALAAAVRSSNLQLINLLVESATVDGPGGYLDDGVSRKYGPNFSPISTPLAEAIRAQDHSRIEEFEQRGALACIARQPGHFLAAVFAAAESGDISYLRKVLRLFPAYRGRSLTQALNIAIRNDQTEAALILLDAGSDVNFKPVSPSPGPPLLEALERKNRRVVDAILESDLDPRNDLRGLGHKTPYLDLAGKWGDLEIIEDLALMGAEVRGSTALVAAVTNRNKPLIDRLLQLGATVNTVSKFISSPLEEAVKNRDYDMMTFLMSQGARVTDSGAFAYAAKHDLTAYNMLLSALKELSPMERQGFGGDLLITAIAQDDPRAVNDLLDAKVDINKLPSRTKRRKDAISPLGFAIKHKKGTDHELVWKLLQAGGDPNSIAANSYAGDHDNYIQCLETPLLLAIQTRNEKMAETLIKGGANVNRPARRGIKRTPLQEACKINSFKMVRFLLVQGARVNDPAAERGGHTALQLAAINGSVKIARLLLDNKADIHGASAKVRGRTAFEGAAEGGCSEMLRLLYNVTSEISFDQEEIQRAREYANAKGHRGCVDYIDSLSEIPSGGFTPFIDSGLLYGEEGDGLY